MKTSLRALPPSIAVFAALGLVLFAAPALPDTARQTLPFSQNWTTTTLITVNDNWSGVPGIVGFRGDGITGGTGVDPQTLLADDSPGVVDVVANQATTGSTDGGVLEIEGIANPTIAMQGSGTADAPYLKIHLNLVGQFGVRVRYTLRDLDGSADNATQAFALQYRVGTTGAFTNVPEAFVGDATDPSTATRVTNVCARLPLAAENVPEVDLRIMTSNANGADEMVGVDDLTVDLGFCPTILSVNDVTAVEGNSGTSGYMFTVSLSSPAGVGGVTFDIATADGTAQDDVPVTEDNDYVAQALTAVNIPMSQSTFFFTVFVNGDTGSEPNETFFVNVSNVTGAAIADAQGLGTIQNDDQTIIRIHDVQGNGAASPLVGQEVTVRGVVTGVRSNGFFVQEEEADYDADPATSEGVLVFTNSAPPAGAVLGALVQVTGTVTEFVPTQDPLQPPLTELTSPTVLQISTGNALPAPIALTATFPDPAGPHDQLERLEGMRVSAASLTVVGPTLGSLSEPNATATSSGVFYAVVTGVARPFREAGIPAPDPAPSGGGSIPPIPRFDSNPERIRVDSDAITGTTAADLRSGTVVSNLAGPLDYTFRTYTILPDLGSLSSPTGGITPSAVTAPTTGEITVAAYNLQRFYDDVDDPTVGEPILTTTALANRLRKASLAIRDYLHTPDILGVVEVENDDVLDQLAKQISVDAVADGDPDPDYLAYLAEGNDPGGIDVGFLIKNQDIDNGTSRVQILEVLQERADEQFVNPNATTEDLHDRPAYRLNAIVHHPSGESFPIVVIVNHLRSLNDANSEDAGSNGWTTLGARVRAKRQKQAESLADLVQDRQSLLPLENLVLIGDFNFFEVNDGLGHGMGVVTGAPVPDNQTAVPGDGIDFVTPNLSVLSDGSPGGSYSYIFDGNAQSLDHVLINAPLTAATSARRVEHPRVNADFPETDRSDYSAGNPRRLADHDPLVAFFTVPAFATTIFKDGFESHDTARWSAAVP